MSKTTRTIDCPTCQGTGDNPVTGAACPTCLGIRHVEEQPPAYRPEDDDPEVQGFTR